MTTPQEKNHTLNRLLAEELAVVAAYEQAEAELAGDSQAEDLRGIEARHRDAAHWLRQRILQAGAMPAARKRAGPISALRMLLALLVGGMLTLFLLLVSGGIVVTAIVFGVFLVAVGWVHYLLWGRQEEQRVPHQHNHEPAIAKAPSRFDAIDESV